MSLLYNVAIHVYAAGVRLAAIKHRKAALMVQGHRETLARIAEVRRNVAPEGFDVWIHAASLGEFEQARPLISMIRRQQPHKRILLSFFSPSGYTVRHAYPDVDLVVYLPFDTPRNARHFV
ncbi:MAG TPA: glycosyltransferase N-terminal domain-containing protein, partial [Muribaculaceae bacterium]|nr:glycosyltransferase N-terminal domain-containing protein [Muribaculaceae bacterium]